VKYALGENKTKIIAVLSFHQSRLLFFNVQHTIVYCCFRIDAVIYTLFFLIEGMRVTGLGSRFISWLCVVGNIGIAVVNAHIDLGLDFYLKCMQRFILFLC
jgi:hypothetical protein